MKRNKDGIFQRPDFPNSTLTDSYFSLLKFEKPDDDLNLNCLAGKFTSSVNYITVFPVDCYTRSAEAYFCSMVYLECMVKLANDLISTVQRKGGIMEQVSMSSLPSTSGPRYLLS